MSSMPQPRLEPPAPNDEHNRRLIENVHPPEWKNPKPKERYNLVVIGAGTAGLVAAAGAASLGASVALVERHLLGGDCLNYGCVPSKALIRAARAAYEVKHSAGFGIDINGDTSIHFDRVMERMRRLRADISPHDSAQRFSKLGVDVYLGNGRFTSPLSLEVDGQTLSFSKAIIATGARAAHFNLPGFADIRYFTNETVFSLTELPKRLLVIGSGPIGCEMAQAFRRFGSDVAIISRDSKLLPKEGEAVSSLMKRRFQSEGIQLYLGANLLGARQLPHGAMITFEGERQREDVVADAVLVAVGRAPNVEDLDLAKAGISFSRSGITVDDHLRTTNHNVYASGDVASRFKFTHAADALSRIALQNALFFGRKRASDLVIPWTTYTDPEVSHVGMYEAEAQSKGLETTTVTVSLGDIDRAVLDGEEEGFAEALVEKRSGKLLGATLVGSHSGESIGELVLAISRGMHAGELGGVIHPYPTQAEAIKRLGDQFNRTRLKPWMSTLLKKYFRWRR